MEKRNILDPDNRYYLGRTKLRECSREWDENKAVCELCYIAELPTNMVFYCKRNIEAFVDPKLHSREKCMHILDIEISKKDFFIEDIRNLDLLRYEEISEGLMNRLNVEYFHREH